MFIPKKEQAALAHLLNEGKQLTIIESKDEPATAPIIRWISSTAPTPLTLRCYSSY